MISFRSLCPIALLLVATGTGGCKGDAPAPQAEPTAAESASASQGKALLRPLLPSLAKIDPQTMKEYRVDVCYFGTLTLKQARDSYLASLGKDEPSEKKIPSFGGEPPKGTPVPDVPKGAPAGAKTAPIAKDAAAVKGAPPGKGPGAPAGKELTPPGRADLPTAPVQRLDEHRPFNFGLRAPHERNARACTVAASLKEPAMPEVDLALAEYAPYAIELAKNIAAATIYYQREEYKKDKFEKGKELHKKLVADFEKLDAESDKLGSAVNAWHKGHPADLSSADEAEKASITAMEDARAVMLSLLEKKVDVAAHKAAVQKLDASEEALKSYGASHQNDTWSKIMTPALDAFLRGVKDADEKLTPKGITDADAYLTVITTFTSLVEAKNRALSRALIAKGQTQAREAANPSPAPSGSAEPAK